MTTKITDANIDSDRLDNTNFNISLLGFKMAVNEGLTVFNLVDGVVDEFNDESGTDEAEGSNDYYCGTSDFYQNISFSPASFSAGFTTSSITEPDTSTAGTNPAIESGQMGIFTVPNCMTSANIFVWGAAGGIGANICASSYPGNGGGGGGGGYAEGTLAVTPSQSIYVSAGEGGNSTPTSTSAAGFLNGGRGGSANPNPDDKGGSGGGLAGTFSVDLVPLCAPQYSLPTAYVVAGSGGGAAAANPSDNSGPGGAGGGAGGGLTGDFGNSCSATEQTTAGSTPASPSSGGGGDQEQGGQGANFSQSGSEFKGGNAGNANTATRGGAAGGGAGYFGGGGGGYCQPNPICRQGGGGGGSSYYGHPQVTSGSTEEGNFFNGGGTGQPNYVPGTNEGAPLSCSPTPVNGEDGYVLITGCGVSSSTASTTIISEPFTSTSVATSSRIVVFEENVDTPTLNTDIIASVSRDGGSTFTNATLADSGYVTGSSGQRILTGQADISGQPSGQSMRWKLALANNQVKIHGVSLQWS